MKSDNSRTMKKRTRRNNGGFTLIEIMIVVFIIALLLNIAAPGFIHARDVGWQRTCCTNLHNIELAKDQFAIDYNKVNGYTPVWSDLSQYIHAGSTGPLCPATSAVYQLNDINTQPVCTYGGPAGLPHVVQ